MFVMEHAIWLKEQFQPQGSSSGVGFKVRPTYNQVTGQGGQHLQDAELSYVWEGGLEYSCQSSQDRCRGGAE